MPGAGWVDGPMLVDRAVRLDLRPDSLGHPLYLLLGHLFIAAPLPVDPDPAFRLNFLSAVAGAVAVGLLAAALVELGAGHLGATVGSLALALSHTHWWHATEAEVYTVHAALLMGAVVLGLRAERRETADCSAFGLVGLGMLNHQLMALAIPGLLALHGAPRRVGLWQQVGRPAAFVAAGLSPLAVLIVRDLTTGATLSQVLNLASGGGFRQTFLSLPTVFVLAATVFFVSLQFGLVLPLLAPWGLARGIGERPDARPVRRALLLWLGLFGFFGFAYQVPDQFAFLLSLHAFIALAIGLGAGELWRRHGRTGPVRRGTLALLALLLLWRPPSYLALVHGLRESGREEWFLDTFSAPRVAGRDDLSYYLLPWKQHDRGAQRYAELVLAASPWQGVVVDDSAHGILTLERYYQRIRGWRPDVTIYEVEYFDFERRQKPVEEIAKELLELAARRPVVLTAPRDYPQKLVRDALARLGASFRPRDEAGPGRELLQVVVGPS